MAEWTPEATEFLDGYLKQVRALAKSSGEDAEEIVSGLRDHIATKVEQESGSLITLNILRQTLAAVGSPESIVEDSSMLSSQNKESGKPAPRKGDEQVTPSVPPPHFVERVVVHEAGGRSRNVLRWVIIAALLVVITPFVLAMLGIVAAIVLPAFARSREAAQRASCQNNLKQIAIAIENYTNEHSDTRPSKMSDLYPKYLNDANVFACPSGRNTHRTLDDMDMWSAYEFVANGNDGSIVREKVDQAHMPPGRNVLYKDGHVAFVRSEDVPEWIE
ncbi:MAG: DUF1559 domain-containing protein [Candidatus Hydrogenedentes bacterium]|nr:DUF1559 domain-containing protein [Candidatus Hydrogenedentota bacterium]